jgi:phosphoglycerol transferase MdoB-like AlkP superfamily enzyme
MLKNINIQKLKINIGIGVVIVLAIAFVITFNHITSNPSSMFSKISDQNYQKLTDIKFVQNYEDGVDAIARLKVSIAKEIDPNERDYMQQNLNYWQDFVSKNKEKYKLLKGV